jgi:hypothetical protein
MMALRVKSNYLMDSLIFGFPNPNNTGMFFYLASIYLMIGTLIYKKPYIKVALWILSASAIYIIYLTQSRTSLFCSLIIALLILFKYFPKPKARKWLIGLFGLSPFILSNFYVFLWNVIENKKVKLMGKPFFSERQQIWIKAYDYLSTNPFAIHYNQNTNVAGSGTFAHNLYISLWWEYGLIIMLAVVGLMLFTLFVYSRRVKTFADFAILCSVGFIFVQQSFEDSLFSSVWMYVMTFSLLCFIGNLDKLMLKEKTDGIKKGEALYGQRKHVEVKKDPNRNFR